MREIRQARGLTLDELAELSGLTKSALSRIETGDTVMNIEHMRRFAGALDVSEEQLLVSSTRARLIPIVGLVIEGATVQPIMAEADQRKVACPLHLDPSTAVALEIRSDSLYPVVEQGWLLFYSRKRDIVPSMAVGSLCVVQLDDGRPLVRHVRRGPTKGHFNLISPNTQPIEDAKLEWAAKIRAILPES